MMLSVMQILFKDSLDVGEYNLGNDANRHSEIQNAGCNHNIGFDCRKIIFLVYCNELMFPSLPDLLT